MKICIGLIAAFGITCGLIDTPGCYAAPAENAPAMGWPFSSFGYSITAGFDLDPASGVMADWTGWRTGEATAGSGHAYDGHTGTDFGMNTGTGLHATARGSVSALRESVANNDHSDTGNYLILNHTAATGTAVSGKDYRTRFWHLSQNGIVPTGTGVIVNKGALVAYSDNTGNSTGPHLHFGISRMPSDNLTCGFYRGFYEDDEFYTASTRPCIVYLQTGTDFLNCREGNSTAYSIFTSLPGSSRIVASQRNGWWRVMLPLPGPMARESVSAGGGLASGYSETGAWLSTPGKASLIYPIEDANRVILEGAGSRYSTFGATGDAGNSAIFNFNVPYQQGLYDVYANWPADANAAGVTYRVTHSGGTTNVVVDQRGNFAAPGNGAKISPYNIAQNPYIVNHTTVGAPDEWNVYSPLSTLPENGPENLYKFVLRKPGTVTVTVDHAGYPTKDVDIHLLNAPSASAAIQRADWTLTSAQLAAGTYYIAIDSYGSGSAGDAAATPYKLTVTFSEDQPFPNSWVKLGRFTYSPGATGSVQVDESTVVGKVDGSQAAKVYADSIRVVPQVTRRTAWVSDGIATQINTAVTPIASVVIKKDKTALSDSDIMDEYVEVPIYQNPGTGTTNSGAIVGKALTGQRFVCTNRRVGDWYEIFLTNGTQATKGWLLGDNLIGYHMNQVSQVDDWSIY